VFVGEWVQKHYKQIFNQKVTSFFSPQSRASTRKKPHFPPLIFNHVFGRQGQYKNSIFVLQHKKQKYSPGGFWGFE
jgi:hypothetical protein